MLNTNNWKKSSIIILTVKDLRSYNKSLLSIKITRDLYLMKSTILRNTVQEQRLSASQQTGIYTILLCSTKVNMHLRRLKHNLYNIYQGNDKSVWKKFKNSEPVNKMFICIKLKKQQHTPVIHLFVAKYNSLNLK